MPKKLNITAKIAPDVLLQEFKSKEFYFFALKISLFRKYVSYFKYRFDTPESLTNKGIKEKPIEMSYHKGSDFNRFFIWRRRRDFCTRSRIVEMRTKHSSVSFLLALCFPSLKTTIQVVFTSSLSRRLTNAVKVQIRHRQKKKTIAPRKVVL